MKVQVLYFSRSGNTKKLAEAISQSIGLRAEPIPPGYPLENVNLLFLGAAVYKGKADPKVYEFIQTLDTKRVKNIALFGTYGGKGDAILALREIIRSKGIQVAEESFLCKGKMFFFFNRKHPDQSDLEGARNFARQVLGKFSS